jgi:hypothetical protein
MDNAEKQALVAKMQADNRECDAAYREMTSDPAYGKKFWLTRKETTAFTLCIVAVFWPMAGARGRSCRPHGVFCHLHPAPQCRNREASSQTPQPD